MIPPTAYNAQAPGIITSTLFVHCLSFAQLTKAQLSGVFFYLAPKSLCTHAAKDSGSETTYVFLTSPTKAISADLLCQLLHLHFRDQPIIARFTHTKSTQVTTQDFLHSPTDFDVQLEYPTLFMDPTYTGSHLDTICKPMPSPPDLPMEFSFTYDLTPTIPSPQTNISYPPPPPKPTFSSHNPQHSIPAPNHAVESYTYDDPSRSDLAQDILVLSQATWDTQLNQQDLQNDISLSFHNLHSNFATTTEALQTSLDALNANTKLSYTDLTKHLAFNHDHGSQLILDHLNNNPQPNLHPILHHLPTSLPTFTLSPLSLPPTTPDTLGSYTAILQESAYALRLQFLNSLALADHIQSHTTALALEHTITPFSIYPTLPTPSYLWQQIHPSPTIHLSPQGSCFLNSTTHLIYYYLLHLWTST